MIAVRVIACPKLINTPLDLWHNNIFVVVPKTINEKLPSRIWTFSISKLFCQ